MSKAMLDVFKGTLTAMKKLALLFYHSSQVDHKEKPSLFKMLLTGQVKADRGAKFMSEKEQRKVFARSNKGLLVDGQGKRLSADDSFKHLLLVAQTGAGKTTKFIIPNVLKLAESKNSILVTDPSGEIFKQTSGYMQSRGFKVLKFDPKDPERSIYFNPLRYVFDYSSGRREVDQIKVSLLAMSLISSSLPGERDFWHIGAEGIIEFLTLCLLQAPKEYHDLYNLYKLAEAVTPTGELLKDFMAEYARDPKLKSKWLSLINNSNETFQSQLATAQTALKPLYNDRIAKMLSKNSIRFSDLKKEKTILYLTFPVNQGEFYTFILNLFYTQLFHEYMEQLPGKDDLPLFVLYDEFGSANIPHFDMIATNIRKYKVSLSLVLQSFSQLKTQYGKDKATTILEGGVNSKLFYAGSGVDTAQEIEKMLGRVIEEEIYSAWSSERKDRKQYNLLNADEIRTLPQNQAFFISGNKQPVLLDIKAFYELGDMKRKCRLPEAYLQPHTNTDFELKCVLDEL